MRAGPYGRSPRSSCPSNTSRQVTTTGAYARPGLSNAQRGRSASSTTGRSLTRATTLQRRHPERETCVLDVHRNTSPTLSTAARTFISGKPISARICAQILTPLGLFSLKALEHHQIGRDREVSPTPRMIALLSISYSKDPRISVGEDVTAGVCDPVAASVRRRCDAGREPFESWVANR